MKMSRTDASSRAEAVRQRRTQRTQDRIQHARSVATGKSTPNKNRYAAEAPTIFVRGGLSRPAYSRGGFGTPVMQRAQTKPRRKVAIPLGTSGAEVIMPAMPIVHVGWRLISGLMVAVLITLLFLVWNMPQFQIEVPVVKGLERLSVDDIQAVVNMEGEPIFMVDQNELQEELVRSFPDLKDISVKVVFPNQLVISAVERQPVMAWVYSGDRTVWVDSEGAMFPARGELKEPILTVNSEVPPPIAIDLEAKAAEAAAAKEEDKAKTSVQTAAASDLDLYKSKIDPSIRQVLIDLGKQMPENTTLVYNPSEGFGWSDSGGWKVFIGQSLLDLNTKLSVYKTIVDQLNSDGQKPSMISVAYVHAPYYRLEQ